MDLVVIDGPNFYNIIAKHVLDLVPDRANAQDYLTHWLDLDRTVLASIGLGPAPRLGVVAVHSAKALGRDASRLGEDTAAFWSRQGANPNFSSLQVVIPGPANDEEKGVDTAIVTYLFETMKHWDSCCIVSQDADFVPAIQSLRRRGKQVFALVDADDRDKAIVRAAQSAFRLNTEFLRADIEFRRVFGRGGLIDDLTSPGRFQDVTTTVEPPTWGDAARSFDKPSVVVGSPAADLRSPQVSSFNVVFSVEKAGARSGLENSIRAITQPLAPPWRHVGWHDPNDTLSRLEFRLPAVFHEAFLRRNALLETSAWHGRRRANY